MALSVFMILPMLAQRQTGSVVGTVTDEEGNILPGVGISVKSPALILPEMTAVTNEQGIYRFPSLPPGTYSITYAMDGMNTLIREGIVVPVGQTVTIDVTLQFKTLEENVVVVGESPSIDKQKSALTTHLDSEFIKAIPAGRDLGSYLFMAPGMIRQEGDEFWMKGTAGMGSNVRENKFNLDGVELNDPTVGTQQVEFGVDIMAEVSVETGGLAAEYGGATGAVVNVISKSGGNDFSGSAAFYFRNEDLQSDNTEGTALEGSPSGFKHYYEPSFTFGGPIIRDKLWFFLGGSYINRAQWIPGYPWDKDDDVPNVQATPYLFGKLSFQPDQNNRFIFSWNFTRESNDNFFATAFDTEKNTFNMKNPIHALNLHWTHFFTSGFFIDFKGNFVDWSLRYDPQEGGAVPAVSDLITGLASGGAGQSIIWGQKRFAFKIDGTLFADNLAGSHEFKTGIEYHSSDISTDSLFIRGSDHDFSAINTMFGVPFLAVQYLDVETKELRKNAHFYIQDTWTISKRLTLNLGARLTHQWLTIPVQNEDEGPQNIAGFAFDRSVTESFSPLKWTTIDPRIGLVFDITGDGRTLLKASFGRFTAPLLSLYGSRFNPNGYAGAAYLVTPDLNPILPLSVFFPQTAKAEYGSHKASAPYTNEFTVALERDVATNWNIGIRYIKKMGRKNVWDVDADQLDIDRLMSDGELVWTNWEQVPFVDPFDGEQKYFWSQKQILPGDPYLLNPPGANRDFDGVEFKLTKRYAEGWFMMASYVWAKARGLLDTGYFNSDPAGAAFFQNPNAHVNALGRVEMDRRHQFKFQGLVQGPWGINFSGFIRYLSGTRYTRMIEAAQLGVPVAQGTAEIFAEERGSRGYPDRFTVDLRLEKMFMIDTITFGVFADAFNLFNSNKALEAYVYSGNPLVPFDEMLRIENPRTFRLGARITF